MNKNPPDKRLLAFVPKQSEFELRVKQLAEETRNIKWSQHALERMAERDISIRMALSVLRGGMVVGKIEAGKSPGEWKAKIVRNVKGSRDVGVVAIVVQDGHIRVATVEWEDMR